MHISKLYDIADTGWVLETQHEEEQNRGVGWVDFKVLNSNSEILFEGYVKWDGCMQLASIGSIHFCGWRRNLELTIKEIYTRVAELMDREQLVAFGNLGDMEKFYNDQNK